MQFRAAILAGGASRRMGHDKAFIEIDGNPLVARVADAARAAGAESIVVVGGDRRRIEALGLQWVNDHTAGGGPAQAILAGLETDDTTGTELVVVLSCDLVNPDPGAIRAIVDALASSDEASIAVPVSGNHRQWLHSCWRTSAAETLSAAIEAGEGAVWRCARAIRQVEVHGISEAVLADADEPMDLPDQARSDT